MLEFSRRSITTVEKYLGMVEVHEQDKADRLVHELELRRVWLLSRQKLNVRNSPVKIRIKQSFNKYLDMELGLVLQPLLGTANRNLKLIDTKIIIL